ncbi:MAG: DEAD/DEAH box helicase [Clostridiales bacterium]|jgi:ATP-dependent RNA helicase DeaD|uniref:DEAD/DEAH box helicase n=2 Tax=Aminipila sp. TaxID=2060095 RepID=UPI001D52F8DD|nr:DEAD/DEAH box helicase [Aminipila sp.]MBE6033688.1 DEAD/DEAH box helicase [Clostridiales bacterium]
MENLNFKELNLSDAMRKALDYMGFEEATPIQSKAIPVAMEGHDVIGQAQTGTGKTCAFGIPAVEMIDSKHQGVQVLVLCPTRELAIQVSEEFRSLCKYKKGIKSLAIYGGQSIERQIIALKGKPQIIIGTPGRIMDHMRRRTLKFENLKMAVLDEADEMLNMGFREDIDTIFCEMPKERQTMLFSATMPNGILEIANLYMNNPEHVVTLQKEVTINTIEQCYIEVRENSKLELLCRLVDAKNVKLGIVFCNTKWKVDELCSSLQARGYSAEALHGDMKQRERDRVMNKFRKGQAELLIATDVAARGIDVNNVEAVFNYDIPSDAEYYVHRIGRTGRAGKKGISYSFVFGRDIYKLRDIERYTKSRITRTKPPTISSIESMKLQTATDEVMAVLAAGGFSKYTEAIERILEETDDITTLDIAAALFKMKFSELESRNYEESDLDNDFTVNKRDRFKDLIKPQGEGSRSKNRGGYNSDRKKGRKSDSGRSKDGTRRDKRSKSYNKNSK